jgi:hypothetical protein
MASAIAAAAGAFMAQLCNVVCDREHRTPQRPNKAVRMRPECGEAKAPRMGLHSPAATKRPATTSTQGLIVAARTPVLAPRADPSAGRSSVKVEEYQQPSVGLHRGRGCIGEMVEWRVVKLIVRAARPQRPCLWRCGIGADGAAQLAAAQAADMRTHHPPSFRQRGRSATEQPSPHTVHRTICNTKNNAPVLN